MAKVLCYGKCPENAGPLEKKPREISRNFQTENPTNLEKNFGVYNLQTNLKLFRNKLNTLQFCFKSKITQKSFKNNNLDSLTM